MAILTSEDLLFNQKMDIAKRIPDYLKAKYRIIGQPDSLYVFVDTERGCYSFASVDKPEEVLFVVIENALRILEGVSTWQ